MAEKGIIGVGPPPSNKQSVCVQSERNWIWPHFHAYHTSSLLLTRTKIKSSKFVMNWNFSVEKLISPRDWFSLAELLQTSENSRQIALVWPWWCLFLGQWHWVHRVRVYSVKPEQASTGHHSPPGCQGAGGWSLGRKLPSRPDRARLVRRSGWSKGVPSWALGCVSADIGLGGKENEISLVR